MSLPLQPLIQPADRVVRSPIEAWWQKQMRTLQRAIAAPTPDCESLSGCLNQLSLLLAFQGMPLAARNVCEKQISFLARMAERQDRPRLLALAIQPWINLARLARWQNEPAATIAMYGEFAPAQRSSDDGSSSLQQRCGARLSLAQMMAHAPEMGEVLDLVYWREFGNFLLDHQLTPQLQAHFTQYFASSAARDLMPHMLELLTLYQIRAGRFDKALHLVSRLQDEASGLLCLPFASLHLLARAQLDAQAAAPAAEKLVQMVLSQKARLCNAAGMYLVQAMARLFQALHLAHAEMILLALCEDFAVQLNDEMLLFETLLRQSELGLCDSSVLLPKFQHSRYAVIRRKLVLTPVLAAGSEAQSVALALDYLLADDLALAAQVLAATDEGLALAA